MYYFSDCLTVDSIKTRYRSLAFEHHPDRGGDLETMKVINREYHLALKKCNLQTARTEEGKEYTYRYEQEIEESVIQVISALIALKMPQVKIMLIGTWLWIVGDTKPFKEALKELKCRWHASRHCWYFTATKHKGFRSRNGLESLAMRYGYADVSSLQRRHRQIEN
jgi:hypothetical protein